MHYYIFLMSTVCVQPIRAVTLFKAQLSTTCARGRGLPEKLGRCVRPASQDPYPIYN